MAPTLDATRRGILEQLGRADASVSELASRSRMRLTGMKKGIGVLEARFDRLDAVVAEMQREEKPENAACRESPGAPRRFSAGLPRRARSPARLQPP